MIRRPTPVAVKGPDGSKVCCFFKLVMMTLGLEHAKSQVLVHEQITRAKIPPFPEALIGQIHGVVHDGTFVFGILLDHID